jgi:hypothetical protein
MIDIISVTQALDAMFPGVSRTTSITDGALTVELSDGQTVTQAQVEAYIAANTATWVQADALAETDSIMDRLTEDVLDNLINGTPIPQAAIDKLAEKKAARNA